MFMRSIKHFEEKVAKMIVSILILSIQLYDKIAKRKVNQYILQINDL